MRIREAVAADIPAIVSIGRQTWPATYAFAGPDYIEDGLRRWWSEAAVREASGTLPGVPSLVGRS